MGFEFEQGWMNDKSNDNKRGRKEGLGKGAGMKGGGRRNINIGGCEIGGEGFGKGGGRGKGKYRLG